MLAIIASSLAPTRIIKWLGACCLVLAALWMTPAMAQEGGKTVRPEIGKPVQAALDLLKQKKGKDALAKVREAEAVGDKTAHETFLIDQVRGQAAALAGEAAVAARAFEAAAASAAAGEKEKQQFLAAAAGQFYLAKEYAKVADMAGRYFKAGGGDKALRTLQIQALYLGGNYALAAKELQADIQADEQAGKSPSEERLQLLSSAYMKQQNSAGYAAALEKLIAYHPKPDYWLRVIQGMTSRPGFPDRLALDVCRLKLATGTMRNANEYVEAAQLSLQAGFPAEAKKFLQAGYESKLLGSGTEASRHQRLKDSVTKALAMDENYLGQEDVKANDIGGDILLNTGFNYVLRGNTEKGVMMMEAAMSKGSLNRLEEAKLHVGIAQIIAGQKSRAIGTLKGVTGKDGSADIARLWVLLARVGEKG